MSKTIDLFDLALGIVFATVIVVTYMNAQNEPQRIVECRDVGGTPQFDETGTKYEGCLYE